jgi:hypothetical protein
LNVCLSFLAIGWSRENHFRLVRSVRRFCRSRVLQWEQERSPVDWPRIKCVKTEKAGAIGDAPALFDPAISCGVDDEMVHQLPTRIHVGQESQERKRCASKPKP